MKLASLARGGRDGSLVVVSKDLRRAADASTVANTLQGALDNWDACEPALQRLYDEINAGRVSAAFAFDEAEAHSPLPRAFQWCEGSVFIAHLERCRRATGRELPEQLYSEIGMYQGGSDSFVAPRAPMRCGDVAWEADLEAGICVIVDDVPMGTTAAQAAGHIKLVVLVNDYSLRQLQYPEMAKGLGVLISKPANAYSPVAVSPGALGEYWANNMLARPVVVTVRDEVIGSPWGNRDALFTFPELIAHLARTRDICAGSIIGAGTVANRDVSAGSACLLERRASEILEQGKAVTPFLSFGDTIRIEAFDDGGSSIFGAIHQRLEPM